MGIALPTAIGYTRAARAPRRATRLRPAIRSTRRTRERHRRVGQSVGHDGSHHRLHLPWRTGHERSRLAPGLDPQTRRRAIGVRQHDRATWHHRLTPIDLRHGATTHRESTANRSAIAGSSVSGKPSRSATTSRVTSSSVGPRPPVSTTRSTRFRAWSNCAASSWRLSPTTDLKKTSMPISFSALVMNNELVSRRDEVSNSLPTAMISAVEKGAHAFRLQQCARCNARAGCAARGSRTTADITSSAIMPIPPWKDSKRQRGIRLDDIQHAEDEEPRDDDAPRLGQHEERDQHADHLVDDTRARVRAAEVALRVRAAPHPDAE